MLHQTATRSLIRSFKTTSFSRSSYGTASANFRNVTPLHRFNDKRPQRLQSFPWPSTTFLLFATKSEPPYDQINIKEEAKLAKQQITPHPEAVSAGSSVRHVFEKGQASKQDDDQMLGGIKADLKTIKETFALTEVPKEPLYIGAAGVLPYAATSLSTVYLAYDINHFEATGSGLLFTPETAHQLLDLVTPIQIGYGAVIISVLGAIHWGLEYAGFGGHHSYNRYMYGVIAPAVAWPTIFMPVEYALITQFVAFNFLYFADARATVRGWCPPWYSTYRFVLTFFVGASIVISLVGRGQIAKKDHSLRSPVDYIKQDRDSQWEALEREEKERRQKLAEEEEAEQSEEEDGEDEEKEDDNGSEDSKDQDKSGGKKEKSDGEE